MVKPVWQPAPLWPLPPCPYENKTARYTPLKKALCWVVGLTLFLPRLLLLLFSLFSVYGIAKLTVIGWDTMAKDRRCVLRRRRFPREALGVLRQLPSREQTAKRHIQPIPGIPTSLLCLSAGVVVRLRG
jgi:hypothetical protein